MKHAIKNLIQAVFYAVCLVTGMSSAQATIDVEDYETAIYWLSEDYNWQLDTDPASHSNDVDCGGDDTYNATLDKCIFINDNLLAIGIDEDRHIYNHGEFVHHISYVDPDEIVLGLTDVTTTFEIVPETDNAEAEQYILWVVLEDASVVEADYTEATASENAGTILDGIYDLLCPTYGCSAGNDVISATCDGTSAPTCDSTSTKMTIEVNSPPKKTAVADTVNIGDLEEYTDTARLNPARPSAGYSYSSSNDYKFTLHRSDNDGSNHTQDVIDYSNDTDCASATDFGDVLDCLYDEVVAEAGSEVTVTCVDESQESTVACTSVDAFALFIEEGTKDKVWVTDLSDTVHQYLLLVRDDDSEGYPSYSVTNSHRVTIPDEARFAWGAFEDMDVDGDGRAWTVSPTGSHEHTTLSLGTTMMPVIGTAGNERTYIFSYKYSSTNPEDQYDMYELPDSNGMAYGHQVAVENDGSGNLKRVWFPAFWGNHTRIGVFNPGQISDPCNPGESVCYTARLCEMDETPDTADCFHFYDFPEFNGGHHIVAFTDLAWHDGALWFTAPGYLGRLKPHSTGTTLDSKGEFEIYISPFGRDSVFTDDSGDILKNFRGYTWDVVALSTGEFVATDFSDGRLTLVDPDANGGSCGDLDDDGSSVCSRELDFRTKLPSLGAIDPNNKNRDLSGGYGIAYDSTRNLIWFSAYECNCIGYVNLNLPSGVDLWDVWESPDIFGLFNFVQESIEWPYIGTLIHDHRYAPGIGEIKVDSDGNLWVQTNRRLVKVTLSDSFGSLGTLAINDTLIQPKKTSGSITVDADDLVWNDYDPEDDDLSVTAVTAVENITGSITLSDGIITFTPTDYAADVKFTYTVSDGTNTSDGNVLVQFEATTTFSGSGAGEVILGSGSADTISGNVGDDLIYTGDGADNVKYGSGDGKDTVIIADGTNSSDTITFETGIAFGDVTFERDRYDLVMKIDSDNQVTVQNFYWLDQLSTYMSFTGVDFEDDSHETYAAGSVLTVDELEQLAYENYTHIGDCDSLTTPKDGDPTDPVACDFDDRKEPKPNPFVATDPDLIGGTGADIMFGRQGKDRLWGKSNNDILYGEDGVDLLLAGSGDDELFGDAGADTLNAGGGTDIMEGGAGKDGYQLDHSHGTNTLHTFDDTTPEASCTGSCPTPRDYVWFNGGVETTHVWFDRSGANNDGEDLIITVANNVRGSETETSVSTVLSYFSAIGDDVEIDFRFKEEPGASSNYPAIWDGDCIDSDENNDGVYDDPRVDYDDTRSSSSEYQGCMKNRLLADLSTTGDDVIYAYGEPDYVDGGSGDDFIFGDNGADNLVGGTGDDVLVGERDEDTYFIDSGDGVDIINDYCGWFGCPDDTLNLGTIDSADVKFRIADAPSDGGNSSTTIDDDTDTDKDDLEITIDGTSQKIWIIDYDNINGEIEDFVSNSDADCAALDDFKGSLPTEPSSPSTITWSSCP